MSSGRHREPLTPIPSAGSSRSAFASGSKSAGTRKFTPSVKSKASTATLSSPVASAANAPAAASLSPTSTSLAEDDEADRKRYTAAEKGKGKQDAVAEETAEEEPIERGREEASVHEKPQGEEEQPNPADLGTGDRAVLASLPFTSFTSFTSLLCGICLVLGVILVLYLDISSVARLTVLILILICAMLVHYLPTASVSAQPSTNEVIVTATASPSTGVLSARLLLLGESWRPRGDLILMLNRQAGYVNGWQASRAYSDLRTPFQLEPVRLPLPAVPSDLTIRLYDKVGADELYISEVTVPTVSLDWDSVQETKGEFILEHSQSLRFRLELSWHLLSSHPPLDLNDNEMGVFRLVVHQAEDLDPRGEQLHPFFCVTVDNNLVHRSQALKRTPNPIFERPVELLITSKSTAVVGLEILDDNTLISDTRLGRLSVKLSDLLAATAEGKEWFPLSQARSGRVRMSASWKPLLVAGAINGAGTWAPPIGVVRLCFEASAASNDVILGTDKPTPLFYALPSRSVVLHFVQDQAKLILPDYHIICFPVSSPDDTYTIEARELRPDTLHCSLGTVEFGVNGLIAEGPDKKTKPWVGTGKVEKREMLRQPRKGVKGDIQFEAEFFPCVHLKDVSFTPPKPAKITEVEESGEDNSPSSSTDAIATPTTASFASPPTSLTAAGRPSTSSTTPGAPGTAKKVNGNGKNEDEDNGVVLPRKMLSEARAGVLAVQIRQTSLPRAGLRVEVLLDSGGDPAEQPSILVETGPCNPGKQERSEIGTALVLDIALSRVWMQVNGAVKGSADVVDARLPLSTSRLLNQCLNRPATFTLPSTDGYGARPMVQIMAKYIPLEKNLYPKVSINDLSAVKVELVDGEGLFPKKERAATSTLSNLPGRTLTTVGGGGVGAGGAVLGGAGTVAGAGLHAVGAVGSAGAKGVGSLGEGGPGVKGHRTGHVRRESVVSTTDGDLAPTNVGAAAAFPSSTAFPPSTTGGDGKTGTLTVTVVKLVGPPDHGGEKRSVEVRFGGKKVLETHGHRGDEVDVNQTAVVKTKGGSSDLSFAVVHKKTFKDEKIGVAQIADVFQHVGPTSPTAQVQLEAGMAKIVVMLVMLEWLGSPSFLHSPSGPSEADARSIAGSVNGSTTSPSHKGRSRFSSGRFGRSREPTPAE